MWKYIITFRSARNIAKSTVYCSFLRNSSGKLVKKPLPQVPVQDHFHDRNEPHCNVNNTDRNISENVYTAVVVEDTFLSKLLGFLPLYRNFNKKITMDLSPPTNLQGMKSLDREKFRKTVQIPGIKVPLKSVSIIGKYLKKSMLYIPKLKNIADLEAGDPDCDGYKLFLIDPSKYPNVDSFTEEQVEFLKRHDIDLTTWKVYDTELSYVNWNYDDILKAVLPDDSDGVGGYSLVGHIAHLNLKDNLLEYKHIIGEVIIDKVSQVRTVVNKLNTIDNTYRNFAMQVIAGDEDFVTTTKEHSHIYKFDFSKVYWNPRLATEHQRVTNAISRGDILYDVFAGVGPFAVPTAKKGCKVIANDLNPESYKWLVHNMKLNKVKQEPELYNLDGREFIRNIVKPHLKAQWQITEGVIPKLNIVMNLPAMAVEFLDVFPGLFYGEDYSSLPTWVAPNVFCYCFSKSEEPTEDARKMVETVLGRPLPEDHHVRYVRNVAPNKEMLCVIFSLEQSLLFMEKNKCSSSDLKDGASSCDHVKESPPQKKFKHNEDESQPVNRTK